jgi:PKD repeat protein
MYRQFKRSTLLLATTSLVACCLISLFVASHRTARAQTNDCPGNVVSNGTFTGSVGPWSAAYGTPDWGLPGQVGMWGNMNPLIGEGLKQTITLVPGQTYNGTISFRIVPGSDKQPNGRIRIRLSTTALTSVAGGTPIFISPMTAASATVWTPGSFSFVAPSTASQVLTINVENTLSNNNGPDTSYGLIDNVCIRQVPVIEGPLKTCVGRSNLFTGTSGASSYNWDFGDGSISNQQNPAHTYSTAGTFTVKLCINGTTNCSTQSITVNPAPPVPVITGPASSCGNQTATYSVAGGGGLSYSWTVSGGTINGSSTGQSVSVTWNSSGVGTISVTVTNKAGCSSTARKEVTNCYVPQGECCHDFQAKTDLKSLTYAGGGVYNFIPQLSVNSSPIVRVVANVLSTSIAYSSASCGTSGPVNASIVSASNVGNFTATIPVTNGDEAIWYGPGATVNGIAFPMQIQIPPPPQGHCSDVVTICIKYTFTNKDCRSCEVIRCYTFKRGGPIKDSAELIDIKVKN